MPSSRRPPGGRRRGAFSHRATPVPPDRMPTTPLDFTQARPAQSAGEHGWRQQEAAPRWDGGQQWDGGAQWDAAEGWDAAPEWDAGPQRHATRQFPPGPQWNTGASGGAPPGGMPPGGMPPGGGPPDDVPPTTPLPDDGKPRKVTVTRVAAARSRELTVAAVRKINAASRADGAGESGLTQLLWVNALHAAGDAMIAVSLAGTLFFAAATNAQRSNVALYLLVTMAPFAVLAPVIGPALDRLQRGRRWAIAASLVGRAVLVLVMAAHFHDFALYPAALGTLVCSKSLNVLRAAVVPRVLPPALSLTSANSRLSVFGLVTAGVFGGVGAGVAKLFGFQAELWVTAVVFVVGGVLAARLPRHVDVPAGEEQAALSNHPTTPIGKRRRRPVGPYVSTALQANAALRGLGGFLTIFSAFLVEATLPGGWKATLGLGAIAAAAGAGSILGTAAGARLRAAKPDRIVLISAGVAAGITVVAAVFYSFPMAAVVAAVSAVTNALGKVALDAIIQREMPEAMRASAFARSETILQLAWVVGGGIGIALPAIGWLGFTVAAGLLVLAVGLVLWGQFRRRGVPSAVVPEAAGPDFPTDPLGPSWS